MPCTPDTEHLIEDVGSDMWDPRLNLTDSRILHKLSTGWMRMTLRPNSPNSDSIVPKAGLHRLTQPTSRTLIDQGIDDFLERSSLTIYLGGLVFEVLMVPYAPLRNALFGYTSEKPAGGVLSKCPDER
jgi:hypothetical protein